ncbi:MAG: amidohydrolase family protein [Candidatus Rokubacteria bacterium]|nr:amidohydrolase family protein [Candidatus Rokubacteria bacterium]
MARRIVLRGAAALLGEGFAFSPAPLDVAIEGDRIASVGPEGSAGPGDEVVDLHGRLLVPGFINGHFHSHEHFLKGRTENLPLELWMHHGRSGLAVPLTPRQTYLRTLVGAIEALRTGTTTVVDDLVLGPSVDRESLDAVFQAYEDIGIRALVGFAMMNRPVVDNFPFAEEVFPRDLLARLREARYPTPAEFLGLCAELARTRHPRVRRVGILVSASAPQRCTEEFLRACRRLADDHGLPVITHVQETRLQVVTGGVFYGSPMVEYLDRVGFLGPRTSLVHAVWLNPREIAALARTGATAQHNPWSNLTLGSGVQPVRALLDAGVNVSLGSDGTCSTVTANMLTVLGSAAALSKIRGDDYARWLSAREALAAATRGGATALGFGGELGVLEPGARADLVGYRLDTIAFAPLNDPIRQLVYAERGAGVDFSMVAGRMAMRAGRLLGIDEPRILAEIVAEQAGLAEQLDRAAASLAPLLEAMEHVYRRCLAVAIPPDTHPARLP